jgi:DNA replication protein DnaC
MGDSGTGKSDLLIALRHRRASIAVGSNEPFSSWTKTFIDPRLCAAIVDRLTYKGQIIETGTSSARPAHA